MASYTIKGGDYWFKIARDLAIDINELLRMNNLSMADVQGAGGRLSVGQEIQIPSRPFQRNPEGEVRDDSRDIPDDVATEAPDVYSDPISEYMDDPAYSAFMAQYNLSKIDIEDMRDMTRENLLAGMRRQLGELTDPSADPYDITAQRAGGELGRARDQQLEQSMDQFAGRGMGFSGGRKKEASRIRTDWLGKEAELEQSFIQGLGQADMDRQQATSNLEMQKIQAENEAYQRRIQEELRATYG